MKEKPGVVVADAGYWSNSHIDALRERGIVPLVAPDTAGKGPGSPVPRKRGTPRKRLCDSLPGKRQLDGRGLSPGG